MKFLIKKHTSNSILPKKIKIDGLMYKLVDDDMCLRYDLIDFNYLPRLLYVLKTTSNYEEELLNKIESFEYEVID